MAYAGQQHEAFVVAQLMACDVLQTFQKRVPANERRLVGALLAMEAVCLDALMVNTIAKAITGMFTSGFEIDA